MSNIDKQALREEFQYMQDHYSDPADRDRQIIYIAAEALLDELEAAVKQNAQDVQIKARLCRESNSLHDRLRDAEKRIAELERSETQLINERDYAESALNDAYKAVMGQAPEWSNWFSFGNAIDEIELACEQWRNQTDDVIQFRQRIAELEAREVTLPPLAPENLASVLDGYEKWLIATTFRDTWNACLAEVMRMNAAGIGVKQQQDSVDSDVGSRNQPGMVVAVHIDAGDFVKVYGQVFEVEETDFDDHDVTLWFVGGNALKCAAGCPVEVVSEPVAADIKVKES